MNIIGKQFVTPVAKGALVASLCAAVAGVIVWIAYPPERAVKTQPIETLQRDILTLNVYRDAVRAEKAALQRDITKTLWTEERFAQWAAKCPKTKDGSWEIKEVMAQKLTHVTLRRVVLERKNATAADWAEIVEVLQKLDREPGVILAGLSIGMPDSESRKFSLVQAVVQLPYANATAHE